MIQRGFSGTRRRRTVLVALGAGALLALVLAVWPDQTVLRWRASAIDRLLVHGPAVRPEPSTAPLVVEIDRASLRALGPWPWPRDVLADLVARIADGQPQVLVLDMVLAGPDRGSPATLARQLAERAGEPELAARIAALPAPDDKLAAALGAAPAVLGFLMSDETSGELPPGAPILVSGAPPRLAPWHAAGALPPYAPLMEAASGLGAGSLDPGFDDVVRRVPLFVSVGQTLYAGLAAETVRLAQAAGAFVVQSEAGRVRIGRLDVPLGYAAELSIRSAPAATWALRTVSAADVLSGAVAPARFAGRPVLVGGGAPELGGLWRTATEAAAPSVQIQADAVETLLTGRVPVRPDWAWAVELAAGLGLIALAALAAAELPPVIAFALYLAGAAAYAGAAAGALLLHDLMIDPVTPAMVGLAAAAMAGLVAFSDTRRAARAMRRRFERHLAPAVVARIAERPDLVRLEGERREVTALFTDIEGFTTLSDRLDPVVLVALLDRYFELVTRLMVEHGGMVDKIVGDAVHAIFNAPLDLPGHERHAVLCGFAIAEATRAFRAAPENAALGLGRTRIGIETGRVVVGEVGAGAKLDYTAHGTPMNTAARLEALNKDLGTTICVGPICRSRVEGIAFRPLGLVEVRGRGPLELFEPLAGERV